MSSSDVFINCPFDDGYKPLFEATVFTIFDCGFRPRCALEADDGAKVRVEKIKDIIKECPLGIHDISRVQLSSSGFPRFNMPFELGLFLGAQCFGPQKQRDKKCLILDTEKFRYQKFLSDIAGQDIQAHEGDVDKLIKIVRRWLIQFAPGKKLPGEKKIQDKYRVFRERLPKICDLAGVDEHDLTYIDLTNIIGDFLTPVTL
jgi:hypothetical protein